MTMAIEFNRIEKLLRRIDPDTQFDSEEFHNAIPKTDSLETFNDDLTNFIDTININSASVEFSTLNKMVALSHLATGSEVKAINHLIEAHAVLHRQNVNLRFVKSELKEKVRAGSVKYGMSPHLMKFDMEADDGPESLKTKLSELPDEWHMIQVTARYEPVQPLVASHLKNFHHTHAMHVTYLPTGHNNKVEPFCITLPKPPCDMYDICGEIRDILSRNKADLSAEYSHSSHYWQMRIRQNEKMKAAITEMEHTWLREWRILFIADPLVPCKLTGNLHKMIDKLIDDDPSGCRISSKQRWLLKKIATCSYCLNKTEILRAVEHVLVDFPKLKNNVVLSIYSQLTCVDKLQEQKRKSLILIVDDYMDYLPFEAMAILKEEPVTRFPCVHVAYAMFKEHEDSMEEGCKVIRLEKELGTFIVNPANNLPKMGVRLRAFINYWLPEWKGIYDVKPDERQFLSALVDHNVLMYNGHGSGIQYLSGDEIERLRVESAVLLFGCSSVKLFPIGGRFPPFGVSNQYLTACSPCVLGMLWEVTDIDTDKMTASFISNWIPSTAPRPWTDVDIEQWLDGCIKFKSTAKGENPPMKFEPELLRALAKAKTVCSQYMTAAAVVVRGLPVKLKY